MNRIIILTFMVSLFLINCAGTSSNGPKVRDHRVSIGLATNEDFVTLANRVLTKRRLNTTDKIFFIFPFRVLTLVLKFRDSPNL